MTRPISIKPTESSRIVQDDATTILFGQPPEVLKGLLKNGITAFDTMVLTDVKEKNGSLLNNLEFPFYFFLFVANGLAQGRKVRLIGEADDISQALRLLRITLMGPTRAELDKWSTDAALKEEWLAVSEALALKDGDGTTIPIEGFFETIPFRNNRAQAGSLIVEHLGVDHYLVRNNEGETEINLNEDELVRPPYSVHQDYVPGGLVKMGLEVLGGASGFTLDEPCTGLALCYNGDYVLIDSIPFLDHHLISRGISKNQVSAVFLTHLHDDHCSMFPLMLMPHKVEIITTREIYNMAMEKLACSLGWETAAVEEHFRLIEVIPGRITSYYGLQILPHVTVHSIPTIGATFSTIHKGYTRHLCVIGDNHSMAAVKELNQQRIVRDETAARLEQLYCENFNMLVADGGAGAIHGDPSDALKSRADRVVFVHVEELPNEFDTTFSLASSGKRYTIIEGDSSIYTSQVNHYLSEWLGRPFPNRWMRSLLADEEIRRYNTDDVIIVQDTETRGYVYLILTGYCDVVHHDGSQFHTVANLQAGDIIGEMAVITGMGKRNASVVAKTPVTVCVFAEEVFGAFIESEGFREELLKRWALRPVIRSLPQFCDMTSNALEKVGRIAEFEELPAGSRTTFSTDAWYILVEGSVEHNGVPVSAGKEYGFRPLTTPFVQEITCKTAAVFVRFETSLLEKTRMQVPQLNYQLRKLRIARKEKGVGWLLGEVATN
ncbi:MAG: cyclic nucleotide-binding domain-containing protein [Pseudomonadales bacterium]|nr:cyclic nucleotide-binding domain-containing protein [Pseudomonadales bacterium]